MNSPEDRCASVQHIFFIKMFNKVYFDVDPIVSSLAMGIGVVVVVAIVFVAIVVVVVVATVIVVVTFCNSPPRTCFFANGKLEIEFQNF